jgi:hypothetical protein
MEILDGVIQARNMYRTWVILLSVIGNVSYYWLYTGEEIFLMAVQLPFRSSVPIG